MKVLIVNTSERIGGAAVAANRLMKALCRNGVDAKMLVNNKNTEDNRVIGVRGKWRKKFNFVWERALIFLLNGFSRNRLFEIDPAFAGTDITQLDCFKEADIIHLHWVNQGMLNLRGLRKVLESGKPVVWTMHDQWCSTGICHSTGDCVKNEEHCGMCPILGRPGKKDLSSRIFERKRKLYAAGNVRFVTCSDWLRRVVLRSTLLGNQKVEAIPNPIDTEVFCPSDRNKCREELGLPANSKLVMVGAVNVLDKRKGYDYMVEVLNRLQQKWSGCPVEVVCMGNGASRLQTVLYCKVHSFEFVNDEVLMAKIYSAVDVFMTSSLFENLPNMIMEAMACGIPCIGFKVGGIPEMIDHRVNGYIVDYKSFDDFEDGLFFLLGMEKGSYDSFSHRCREKVLAFYSEEKVSMRFVSVYDDTIRMS